MMHNVCPRSRVLVFATLLFLSPLFSSQIAVSEAKPGKSEGLEIQQVADLIHAIVAANREAYSKVTVERLASQERVIVVDEQFHKKKALPLPAQLFRFSAELAGEKSQVASYALLSFWALRRENLPSMEMEKIGLANVLGKKKKYYGVEVVNGFKSIIATYPDNATSQSCVTCHNNHPKSRRHDFKLGDVLGGVVVRIPFAKVQGIAKKNKTKEHDFVIGATEDSKTAKLSYREVADIVHAIVSANREAYSKLVVNRLTVQEKVIEADEHFLKKKALPLPAQHFRLGALLASEKSQIATYSLRSLWPLKKYNAADTEVEKIGLARVAKGSASFYSEERVGEANEFVAVYPDIATNESCVSCHNNHESSPRRDFKLGDVMGGVVVRIPMRN